MCRVLGGKELIDRVVRLPRLDGSMSEAFNVCTYDDLLRACWNIIHF